MVDYDNGLIPPSLLRRVSNFAPLTSRVNSNLGSDLLREDAWAALNMLQVAFRQRFGRSLNVSEAYRGRTLQTAYWREYQAGVGNLAAYPGTSNHGWAVSCDFGSGVGTYGSASKVWMDENAPRFGWRPTGNSFATPEGWHYDFIPGTATETIPASGGATPIDETEDDMFTDDDRRVLAAALDEAKTIKTAVGIIQQAVAGDEGALTKVKQAAGRIDAETSGLKAVTAATLDEVKTTKTGVGDTLAVATATLNDGKTTKTAVGKIATKLGA